MFYDIDKFIRFNALHQFICCAYNFFQSYKLTNYIALPKTESVVVIYEKFAQLVCIHVIFPFLIAMQNADMIEIDVPTSCYLLI